MLKTVITYLLSQLPDTVKIVIATVIIALMAVISSRAFNLEEIKAYVDPIQESNNQKFSTLLQHSELSYQLLRDDIRSVRDQNNKIIDFHLKQNKRK